MQLVCSPIAFIKSTKLSKFDAPHQPNHGDNEQSFIEFLAGDLYQQALRDLEGFERIWLLWWFHKNSTWRPTVQPPRGGKSKRGLFATRSPHRPNPIGITVVKLLEVTPNGVLIGSNDLIDGTPILDIKPYLPYADSFPDSAVGWVGELEQDRAEVPKYKIQTAPLAEEQLGWLATEWKIDFFKRAKEILEIDPSVNRTRRIKKLDTSSRCMSCGPWRMVFTVEQDIITVTRIAKGYPDALLNQEDNGKIVHREAQIAFSKRWSDLSKSSFMA